MLEISGGIQVTFRRWLFTQWAEAAILADGLMPRSVMIPCDYLAVAIEDLSVTIELRMYLSELP